MALEFTYPIFLVPGEDFVKVRNSLLKSGQKHEPFLWRRSKRSFLALIDPDTYFGLKDQLRIYPYYFRKDDMFPPEDHSRDLFLYTPGYMTREACDSEIRRMLWPLFSSQILCRTPYSIAVNNGDALILRLDDTNADLVALIKWILCNSSWNNGKVVKCSWLRVKHASEKGQM